MHDDDAMDQLLTGLLRAEVPQLSPGFDARVMRRVKPRRLTAAGRFVLAIYVVVAAALAVWLMRDLPIEVIAAATAIGVPVAGAAAAYGRHVAVER